MWRESASMKRAGGFIYENWFWAILCGGYLWMDNSQKLLDVLGYIYRIQACGFMCDISCVIILASIHLETTPIITV